MKRQATQSKQRSSSGSRRHRYTKVLDNRKHPVRGLWKRNGSFLARLTVEENDGKRAVKWAPLKATTAAEAITELKALHTERSENRLRCIGRTPKLSEAI